ncbi:MAG: hypothetical protein M3297_13790 [Thermoproteota archaeon]|nr:hypothetical protein [Thermoproteota archaeon]
MRGEKALVADIAVVDVAPVDDDIILLDLLLLAKGYLAHYRNNINDIKTPLANSDTEDGEATRRNEKTK